VTVEALSLNLGSRSYALRFGPDLTEEVAGEAGGLVRAGRQIAILTDSNVAVALGARMKAMFGSAPVLALEPGEETKSLAGLGRVLEFLAEGRLDRSAVLFAVGGGVIGDIGGFAAASFLRGIDYYQVPTTLLAMVDSSVGGKTGVNLAAGKNLAGAFHQPRGVFISTELLASLPPRELAAGMAEVIKYGLLADAALFARLESGRIDALSPELPELIRRCCAIKARIVEADERELASDGGRALLNLGHTFGHAIERSAGYGAYLHGEAVAVGLAAAARLSHSLGFLPAGDVGRIDAALAMHILPTRLREPIPLHQLMDAMTRDKKARGGVPRFIVLHAIGQAAVEARLDPALIEESWRAVGAN
jgi:3-dehydroquinate synthase